MLTAGAGSDVCSRKHHTTIHRDTESTRPGEISSLQLSAWDFDDSTVDAHTMIVPMAHH